MTRRPLIGLTAACLMIVAACGDDNSGGSNAAFCEIFVEQDSIEFADDSDPAEAIAALNRLKDAAPDAVKDDVTLAVDGFTALTEIDFSDATEEDFAALEARFEEANAAADRVEVWVRANCDNLPDDFFQS